VKILDTLLGRSKPVGANLDALFALPSAAITLQTGAGYQVAGRAGVCFKPVAGQSFEDVQTEIGELLGGTDGDRPKVLTDSYDYRWVLVEDPETEGLVTKVHSVNSTLFDHGYDSQLLCSVFALEATGGDETIRRDGTGGGQESAGSGKSGETAGRVYLVYLFKRGTFYYFAPTDGEKRDSQLELRLKAMTGEDLPLEDDLSRWFPIWSVPV
jgi:PspA associated protein B